MPFPLPANSRFLPVPDELREILAPAQLALFEWTDYFFCWPGADALRVGERHIEPVAPGTFRVRWENALGLASLVPWRRGEPLEAPLWVEVLSPKLPTPALHVAFLRALLKRLFALSPHLIWHDAGATARGAGSSNRPSSAPETLRWSLQNGGALEGALAAIARQPARAWVGHTMPVAPAQVSDLGASAVATLAGAPWQTAPRGSAIGGSAIGGSAIGGSAIGGSAIGGSAIGGSAIGGSAPVRVPQTRRRQSFDVPENRGALAFVGALENAIGEALGKTLGESQNGVWARALSEDERRQIERLRRALGAWLGAWRAAWPEPIGAPRGAWQPRAAPYRALWQLEQSWRGAGAPLWANAERLAQLRDIASLWELHVFFDLIARIEGARGARAHPEINWDAGRGMLASSRAYWPDYTLTFNGPAPSYSTPLRPDYLWSRGQTVVAAFDAKFRFEASIGNGRGADLHKMHAYRDALNVSAAIALHPGTQTTFFDRERGPLARLPLQAILEGAVAGVGLWGIG